MKDFDPDADTGSAPSPCINVCRMNPVTGTCEGCQRTLDEIAQWGAANEEARRAIWRRIKQRREQSPLNVGKK